jgi:hypothetical protein
MQRLRPNLHISLTPFFLNLRLSQEILNKHPKRGKKKPDAIEPPATTKFTRLKALTSNAQRIKVLKHQETKYKNTEKLKERKRIFFF